ncbi:MAG: hypothetical protein RLY86_1357 [Pseudomonadota bacterium]|jgi:hypothetical protein
MQAGLGMRRLWAGPLSTSRGPRGGGRALAVALFLAAGGQGFAGTAAIASTPVEPPLRIIFSEALPAPYLTMGVDGQTDGIGPRLARALARELGRTAIIATLPRRRVEPTLRAGQADLLCHAAPAWLERPEDLIWSGEVYTVTTILFARPDSPPVDHPKHLSGPVGAILGYRYAMLDEAIASGRVQRIDSRSEEAVFTMVERGRLPYGLIEERAFQDLGAARPGAGLIRMGVVGRYSVECAAMAGGSVQGEELRAAAARAVRSPDITGLFSVTN